MALRVLVTGVPRPRWRSQTAGQHRQLIAGNLLSQVVLAASMPVITAVYSPAAFGTFALYDGWLQLFGNLPALGTEVRLASSPGGHIAAVRRAARHLLGATSAVAAVVAAAGGLLFLDDRQFAITLAVLAAATWLARGLSFLERYEAVLATDLTAVVRHDVVLALSLVLMRIGGGLLRPTAVSLFGAATLAPVVAVVVLRSTRSPIGHQPPVEAGISGASVASREIPGLLLQRAPTQLAVLAAGLAYGPSTAGQVAVAQLAVLRPQRVVSRALADVTLGRLASPDSQTLRSNYGRHVLKVGGLTTLIAIVVSVVGGRLVPTVLDSRWHELGDIIASLAPVTVGLVLLQMVTDGAAVLGRFDLRLAASALPLGLALGISAPAIVLAQLSAPMALLLFGSVYLVGVLVVARTIVREIESA